MASMKALQFSHTESNSLRRECDRDSAKSYSGSSLGDRPLTKKTSGIRRIWVLAIVLVTVFVGFGMNAGRLLVVDAAVPSDVILVLAGETDHRPARALQLLDQGYGRRVVIDVPAATRVYKFTQVELAQEYMRSLPQRASVRICPITGLSTREESHDAEKCLVSEDGTRVLIVTSDFHTRRALSIFRHEVQGKSFSVAAARDDIQFGARWWTNRQWAKTCLDEWLRLVWWNGVERWR
jgi:hypothetical protein